MLENITVYEQYKKTSLETSSPGRLLLMLFDGALSSLEKALEAIQDKNIEKAHQEIVRVQNILVELMESLNMDYDISTQLLALYSYLHGRLIEANLHKDAAILEEVRGFVLDLRDTWHKAVKLAGSSRGTASPTCSLSLNVTG